MRLFSRITIPAGGSIGYHIHEQEAEFSTSFPEGMMDDNGSPAAITAGDATVTRDGEGHGVVNTGSSRLELLARYRHRINPGCPDGATIHARTGKCKPLFVKIGASVCGPSRRQDGYRFLAGSPSANRQRIPRCRFHKMPS